MVFAVLQDLWGSSRTVERWAVKVWPGASPGAGEQQAAPVHLNEDTGTLGAAAKMKEPVNTQFNTRLNWPSVSQTEGREFVPRLFSLFIYSVFHTSTVSVD